ncbi:MAG: peptide deformylase [Gemmataceae bacterium]|nr:peptide deformylase [Gemmataceae bacterium]
MQSLKIVQYPHPALRFKAKPVTSIDKEFHLRIGRMFELMYEAKGLGLAANQVAIPHQFLVFNITGDPSQKELEEVFINPVIVERKGTVDDSEGCLSFPGLFQRVRRAKSVKVQAYNINGEAVEIEATGLASRAWQHEIDHLNGVLFVDKMSLVSRIASKTSLGEMESEFRLAQKNGEVPKDLELGQLLDSLACEA